VLQGGWCRRLRRQRRRRLRRLQHSGRGGVDGSGRDGQETGAGGTGRIAGSIHSGSKHGGDGIEYDLFSGEPGDNGDSAARRSGVTSGKILTAEGAGVCPASIELSYSH
jgi:hypothetical protein